MAIELLDQIPVTEAMTSPVKTLSPTTTVREASACLSSWRVGGAPIVGREGGLLGVFTLSDLARYVRERGLPEPGAETPEARSLERRDVAPDAAVVASAGETTIGEYKFPGAFTLFEGATLGEAVGVFAMEGIHRLFVLTDNGLAGVVTPMDIIRRLHHARAGRAAAPAR